MELQSNLTVEGVIKVEVLLLFDWASGRMFGDLESNFKVKFKLKQPTKYELR